MKKLLLIIFVMAISANINADAYLVAPANQFDFGLTPTNSILYHGFWLKSIGTDTVVIDEIKTGCSCAITNKESDRIAPGDSMLIDIEWNVTKYRDAIFRSIRIFYNGNPDPIRVSMKGQIQQSFDILVPVSIKPYRFEFGHTTRKDIDSIPFIMTNTYSIDYEIKVISDVSDKYTIKYPKSIKANESVNGYIKLNKDYKDDPFQTAITFSINDKNKTNITIPIRRKFYR